MMAVLGPACHAQLQISDAEATVQKVDEELGTLPGQPILGLDIQERCVKLASRGTIVRRGIRVRSRPRRGFGEMDEARRHGARLRLVLLRVVDQFPHLADERCVRELQLLELCEAIVR